MPATSPGCCYNAICEIGYCRRIAGGIADRKPDRSFCPIVPKTPGRSPLPRIVCWARAFAAPSDRFAIPKMGQIWEWIGVGFGHLTGALRVRLVEGGRYESDSEHIRRVPHDHWPHTPRGPRDWRLKLNYSSIVGRRDKRPLRRRYSSIGGPTTPDPNGSTTVDSSSSDKPTSLG